MHVSRELYNFIEQEITGDVLLDLDVNLLKSEIGIPAFGKRMRIANFIADLRRPPSVVSSDHITNPSQSISQSQSQPYGFSHSHSLSQSVHSSAQTSLNSPYYTQPFSPGFGSIMSVESPIHTGDLPGTPLSPLMREQRRVSDPVSIAGRNTNLVDSDDQASGSRGGMVGLGLGVPGAYPANVYKNRPAQLMLSPSDSNLVTSKAVGGDIPDEADEERAAASEVRDLVFHYYYFLNILCFFPE
jgi:SAM domain (Sterile alpha motif)